MSEHPQGISARADLIGGIAWTTFGVAIVIASVRMDRLDQFGATLYTAPGLVPGLIGALLALLGLALVLRSLRRRAGDAPVLQASQSPKEQSPLVRTAVATVLALVYMLVLIGRMPFPIATAMFVFAFIMMFGVSPTAAGGLARRAVVAAVTAIATAAIVTLVFQYIFLVRLP